MARPITERSKKQAEELKAGMGFSEWREKWGLSKEAGRLKVFRFRHSGLLPLSFTVRTPAGAGAIKQPTREAVSQEVSKETKRFVKATFYLSLDQIISLEKIRVSILEQGKRTDKSALVRQAIDLLIKQHTSKLA